LYGVLHTKGENTYALVECTGETIVRKVGNLKVVRLSPRKKR